MRTVSIRAPLSVESGRLSVTAPPAPHKPPPPQKTTPVQPKKPPLLRWLLRRDFASPITTTPVSLLEELRDQFDHLGRAERLIDHRSNVPLANRLAHHFRIVGGQHHDRDIRGRRVLLQMQRE